MVKAIILSAGLGTRLGHITKDKPKCLVEVNNIPMLDHWISKLSALGVEQFLVNTHYCWELVEEFWKNHDLRNKIHLVREEQLLGTGGTVKRNLGFFNSDANFIVHADNYCQDDLIGMKNLFEGRPSNICMTMLTFTSANPSECGIVRTNKKNIMKEFHEKVSNPPGNEANGAVYLCDKHFFKVVEKFDRDVFDLTREIIPKLSGRVTCYSTKAFFADIGTPQSLIKANKFARSQNQTGNISVQ